MKNNDDVIIEKFKKELFPFIQNKNDLVILYGSSAYSTQINDLDVCIITQSVDDITIDKLSNFIREFHLTNNLSIDEEIPYKNKITYTYNEINQMFSKPPIPIIDEHYHLSSTIRSPWFLETREMRFRLILNILTTRIDLLYGDEDTLKNYVEKAWIVLTKVVFSNSYNIGLSVDEFLHTITVNPCGGKNGSDYLGYKIDKNIGKDECLKHFDLLERKNYLYKDIDNKYYPCFLSPVQNRLDFSSNLNPLEPPNSLRKIYRDNYNRISEYPDYQNKNIQEKLAAFFGVNKKNVYITNGSLEGIYAIPRIINVKKACVFTPSFWGYAESLLKAKTDFDRVSLDFFDNYSTDVLSENAKKHDLLFICNPNNPTTAECENETLFSIITENKHCLFVVDESHMLFFDSANSMAKYVDKVDNLVVLTSLSKFFSVPGIRAGAIMANQTMIDKFIEWQVPYSFNSIAQCIISECLSNYPYVRMTKYMIPKLALDLLERLKQVTWLEPIEKIGIFVVCKVCNGRSSADICSKLQNENIILRDLTPLLEEKGDWLRITVGTVEKNKILVDKMLKL